MAGSEHGLQLMPGHCTGHAIVPLNDAFPDRMVSVRDIVTILVVDQMPLIVQLGLVTPSINEAFQPA